jgi:hypothetical protein
MEMKIEKQIPVAIYGSSLFLTAVASLLMKDERYQPIFFSEFTAISTILYHNPALLLHQKGAPLDDIPVLLAAGLVVVEITPDKNQMTLFQHQTPPQCVAVSNTAEFQTKITLFISPRTPAHQPVNAAIFNETAHTTKGIHS